MKATLLDRRHRREALTGGDQPWPWCVPPPGGGSVWPCSRCVDTSGQMRGQRGPRLRNPDWKKLVAGTLSYPQTETGPYQILVMSYVRTPVAQLVEHGISNAKLMGSIPRESKS